MSVHLLQLPTDKVSLYEGRNLFGDQVAVKFPSASFDIEEAGKCLALDRSTATIFHLVRIIETGLRTLGKSLNDPSLDPIRNPTWETILRKCDEELKKPIRIDAKNGNKMINSFLKQQPTFGP